MVWSRNALSQALARYRSEQTKARSQVERPMPGDVYTLPKRDYTPPNQDEVAEKRRNNFVARLRNINDAYDYEGPSGQPSDYLERAEDIMFQANKMRQKTEQRLANPIVKEVPFTYDVNVPMNVPQYYQSSTGKIDKRGRYIDPAVTAAVRRGDNSMTAAEVKAQEAAILAGRKPKRAQSGNSFEAFVRAISGKESGGNYSAVNRDSGAAGRYQILPGNFTAQGRGWDMDTLGRDVTLQQFMSNPKIQDAIARGKLQQYYNQYGARGAASAWYSGDPNKWRNTASQGGYPTIAAYVNDIIRRMGGR